MSEKIVHVVGTGTIGEPLIGLLTDFREQLGIDMVTFHKRTPLRSDRAKVLSLQQRGAHLAVNDDAKQGFLDLGINPSFETVEAIDAASVVIDCTPKGVGHQNKNEFYKKFTHNTLGFIAQGSESGFGKMYVRGVNDQALVQGEDQFLQVVSCNTHNIAALVKTLAMDGEEPDNLVEGRFICIRRANDLSQDGHFIPSPEVGMHLDEEYGTHHARDAVNLFRTLGITPNLFSSALKVNSQYMHVLWFNIKVKRPTTIDESLEKLESNPMVACTDKQMTSLVFSFGRDQGHYGRILNQTVVSLPTLAIRQGTEIVGFSFTPQDGNPLLSSIAAAMWYLYPENYTEKIQCLQELVFSEV